MGMNAIGRTLPIAPIVERGPHGLPAEVLITLIRLLLSFE